MRSIFSFLLFLSLTFSLQSQSAHKHLMDGDKYYSDQDFSNAELSYRKAKEKNNDLKSNYNLGNSTYNQERFEESIDYYMNASSKAVDPNIKSDAYYNLGNAYFKNQDFEKALEAYKASVKNNPSNKEARYNLANTSEVLKQIAQQQQQQQQNQNQDQENQDQQEQDNQDQQEQENQDQQDQESQDQQDQNEQDRQEEKKDSTDQQNIDPSQFDSTRLEKQSLDSLDAQKLLQIIQDEELKVQEKLRKFNSKRKKPDKDW